MRKAWAGYKSAFKVVVLVVHIQLEVDAKGLICPMPLLRAKQALSKVASGECVRVLATDGGSRRDFVSYARLAGHALLEVEEADGVYIYVIQKKWENSREYVFDEWDGFVHVV